MANEGNVIGFSGREPGNASKAGATSPEVETNAADSGERSPDALDDMSIRLIAVAEHGDREAFGTLFRHFGPRIRAYLARGGGDMARIDDVLQDVFAAVWRKASLYDSRRATAAAWIFAIARNRRIDALRRERRPEFDPQDPAFRPDPVPDGEETLAARQRARAVRTALTALSDEQREILRLSFYEGESYPAIAIRLGIPLGTVKSRARLAFGHLRAELGPRREELL